MNDRDAAGLIHEQRTDVLIDLTGYTAGCRPQIVAWRPAPIAVNYLGFPASMAAPFVDYIIADKAALPLEQQRFYTEKIVHLPDSFQPNDAKRTIAAETPTRGAVGLPDTGFVFCCFNRPYKITAQVFAVWMRLLGAVEGSVLWLAETNETASANLRAAATAAAIDPARLVFAPRVEHTDEHLARQRLADLFLDTLPFNAHATASDALWAGLPVITCTGNAFAGRVGTSLLNSVGLADLVTADLAAYEALALRLARAPQALADCKRRLENRASAPLFDSDRLRHHLEAAYLHMYSVWRSGKPPKASPSRACRGPPSRFEPTGCPPPIYHRADPAFSGETMSITLDAASTIIDVALRAARDMNLVPMTVAVLDAGGHLVAFKREDKSGILRHDIAYGKAWGALGMGFGSRTLFERAADAPQFFNALFAASGGRMVANPGGVLIRNAAGDVIGAVGISGDTADRDEACAIAGIEAAGLTADPGGLKR